MNYLTTSQLRNIIGEYLPDHLSRLDYEAALIRKDLARAEIARRKNCKVVQVKVDEHVSVNDLTVNGWTIGFNSDENFFFGWKRPNELTKFDRGNFLYFYT